MRNENILINFFTDFRQTIIAHQKALHFIARHQLWKGFLQYGWVSKLLLVVGLIVSFKFSSMISSWWHSSEWTSMGMALQSLWGFFVEMFSEGYSFLFLSGFKYIIMVFMELLLFHFVRRTLEIKTGQKQDHSFKTFVQAEFRMIKVAFIAYILENLVYTAVRVVFNIIGLEVLNPFAHLIIQCYFLGFIVIDNYNELFGIDIRQSERITRRFLGVAIGLGLITYGLLLIPIVGAVIAPFIGAVTATLVMMEYRNEHQLFIPLKEELV